MAPLIDPSAQTQSADWRRQADPPSLWLAVLSSSIVIHVLLALTLRWWSMRVAIAQPSSTSSTPVELVDIAPETAFIDAEAVAPAAPITQDPVTDSTSPQADDGAAVLEPGVTALLPESVEATVSAPSPSPSSSVSQPPQPSSAIPPASLPFTPPVLPSPEPSRDPGQETSAVPPVPDNNQANNQAPVAPDNGSATPADPNTPPAQSPEDVGALPEPEGQTATAQEGSEDPLGNPDSASEESETESNPLPPAPTPVGDRLGESIGQVPVAQNSVPAEFQASLSVSAPEGTGAVDIHDQPASPKVTNQTFLSDVTSASGCALAPESVQYFGQSVELRIAIDEQGRVLSDATVIRQPSGSESFDQLATCVIAAWEFNPAFDRINNIESAVSSNLDVFVTINSIN